MFILAPARLIMSISDQVARNNKMKNVHPGLPDFDYVRPKTLEDASQFLASHEGDSRPFLGGTDTFIRMRDGEVNEKYLVDVKKLEGLDEISFDTSTGLTVGAAVSMNQVSAFPEVKEYYPVLAEAIDSVASYQLRTRATVIGNICNASPAGDTIGVCLLLDGELNVYGIDGERKEPLKTFFLGPGQTVLKTGDIVTSLQLPVPPRGAAGKYLKHGRNKRGDLSIVGVAVIGYPDEEIESGFRFKLALTSVASVPLVVEEVEEFLAGTKIDEESFTEAARIAMDVCDPIDDVRSSARYRRMMVRNLSRRAMTEVWGVVSQ